MKVNYQAKALKTLDAKLKYVQGPGSKTLAGKVAEALEEGNRNDRLAGTDRYGQPLAPVKPRRGKYKNASGPPLAPFGAASRVVTHFRTKVLGQSGNYHIAAGWDNVLSKQGVPFLPFHDQGVRLRPNSGGGLVARNFARIKAAVRGSWFLPPRPIFGISPRTWARIRPLGDTFKAGVKKVK